MSTRVYLFQMRSYYLSRPPFASYLDLYPRRWWEFLRGRF